MQPKFAKTAARTAAVGALTVASGLGFAQAAMAKPAPSVINVPCSATALASDITANTGGETLSLAKFCVYRLTAALPDVTEDLTINGNQSTIERSYGTGTADFTILPVTEDIDLVVNRVNFRNGGGSDSSGEGGAIDNEDGTVTVNGGTFTGNAAQEGGAISNESELTVNGASFTGNTAGVGGGIANEADATVTGSSFTGNSARSDGGGIYVAESTTVANCNFTRNSAGIQGGGIYANNNEHPALTVTGSGFYQNRAEFGGGILGGYDLTLTGSAFTGNTATRLGGGVVTGGNNTTVNGVTFRQNTAADGGGLYISDSTGAFTLNGGSFTGNDATRGGGIENGNFYGGTLNGVTFRLNRAEFGGGIYDDEIDPLTVTDSLITGNTATSGGGGIYIDLIGTVTLTRTSVVGNRPDNCEPLNTIKGCTG